MNSHLNDTRNNLEDKINHPIRTTDRKTNEEEIVKFLLNGAQPTRTVKSILVKAGVWAKFEEAKKN